MTTQPYPEQLFLADFDLHNLRAIRRLEKKHPSLYGLKMDDNEGIDHWNRKIETYSFLEQRYSNNPKFFITTELQQEYNPFISELDASKEYYKYYRLDICVIFFNNPRQPVILDVEIDNKNHYKKRQMDKDLVRDELLKMRYNVHTERIDVDDPSLKHVIAFLHSRIGS